jgi:hypothetical protein
MYNSNPEVVKQQEREKQEKILEKERNVVALHVPKSLNPILQKKADNLKATADREFPPYCTAAILFLTLIFLSHLAPSEKGEVYPTGEPNQAHNQGTNH